MRGINPTYRLDPTGHLVAQFPELAAILPLFDPLNASPEDPAELELREMDLRARGPWAALGM